MTFQAVPMFPGDLYEAAMRFGTEAMAALSAPGADTSAVRHGLWRPLWLVDVALLVESLPPGFDWDACLSASAWAADGVRHVVSDYPSLKSKFFADMPVIKTTTTALEPLKTGPVITESSASTIIIK